MAQEFHRIQRLPYISPGQPITARWLNDAATIINEVVLAAPRDLDSGALAEENAGLFWDEISRDSLTVRVTNPEDEDQYVDVDRAEKITFHDSDGRVITMTLKNES